MVYPNLMAELARRNIKTAKDVAPIIKASEKSASNKLAGRTDWKRGEMKELKDFTGCTMDYLFDDCAT